MTDTDRTLSDSAFVVLAVLAERAMHGYELQKIVHTRGFVFWTRLRRTSIYKALRLLEKQELISARSERGDGPSKKVYSLTASGREQLGEEALRKLAAPTNPHNEVDSPSTPCRICQPGRPSTRFAAAGAICAYVRNSSPSASRGATRAACACQPLAFERPLVALEAEIGWLDRVLAEVESGAAANPEDWQRYVYAAPPPADRDIHDPP